MQTICYLTNSTYKFFLIDFITKLNYLSVPAFFGIFKTVFQNYAYASFFNAIKLFRFSFEVSTGLLLKTLKVWKFPCSVYRI